MNTKQQKNHTKSFHFSHNVLLRKIYLLLYSRGWASVMFFMFLCIFRCRQPPIVFEVNKSEMVNHIRRHDPARCIRLFHFLLQFEVDSNTRIATHFSVPTNKKRLRNYLFPDENIGKNNSNDNNKKLQMFISTSNQSGFFDILDARFVSLFLFLPFVSH